VPARLRLHPLGGNRHGERQTYRNLLLTMLIGGLWHGANWTFIIWGAYHGCCSSLSTLLDALGRPAGRGQTDRHVRPGPDWLGLLPRAGCLDGGRPVEADVHPDGGTLFPGVSVFLIAATFAGLWAMAGPNAFDLHAEERPRYGRVRALAVAAMLGACLAVMRWRLLAISVFPF